MHRPLLQVEPEAHTPVTVHVDGWQNPAEHVSTFGIHTVEEVHVLAAKTSLQNSAFVRFSTNVFHCRRASMCMGFVWSLI